MPTYEYSCQKCGHDFEYVQSMTAPALTICPKDLCSQKKWGKGKVKRGVGGGTGLIFKGSGFYITDYRSEGYKAAAKNESGGGKTAATAGGSPAAPAAPAAGGSGGTGSSNSGSGSGSASPAPKAAPQKSSGGDK